MVYKDSRTVGTPILVAPGEDKTINEGSDYNYGDAKDRPEVTIPVAQNRDNRYDLEQKRGESFGKATFAGHQVGGQVQLGALVKIDGTPSQDLEVVFDVSYHVYLKSIFFSSASAQIYVGKLPQDGPRFPTLDAAGLEEQVVLSTDRATVDNLENSVFEDRWINNGTSASPLHIPASTMSDGDELRLVCNLTTSATVTKDFAESKADAYTSESGTGFGGNLDGYCILSSVDLTWK